MLMKRIFIATVVAVLLIAGGYYLSDAQRAEDMQQVNGEVVNLEDTEETPEATADANIVGTWQSDTDGKFTRAFSADGTAVDFYEGVETSRGTWRMFTSDAVVAIDFPLEADATYVEITEPDAENLYFKLAVLTPERLELIYMNRGGALMFTRID
jgi:hypothetical protein